MTSLDTSSVERAILTELAIVIVLFVLGEVLARASSRASSSADHSGGYLLVLRTTLTRPIPRLRRWRH